MLTPFALALPSNEALVSALVLLFIVGVIAWFVLRYVPLAEPIAVGVKIVLAIFVVLVLVRLFAVA